jgi:hypothetical protein
VASRITGYERGVKANGRDTRGEPPGAVPSASSPPRSSESGIRPAVKPPAPARRRENSTPNFRELTPYQARLDVEMDDTAISKVRDPSVSIALGADASLPPRRRTQRVRFRDAALSVGAGVVLGALVVVLVVFLAQFLGF